MTSTDLRRASSIRIFLVDGTPQGLRVVDKPGWTGCCLALARADYAAARKRDESTRTGVYLLVGPDPAGERDLRLYVGEADEVRVRLDQHQREKEFWTHAVVLTTKDESLNKAHVRYLESRLVSVAREASRATIENGTAPPLPHLSEAEVADMEAYLDQVLTLLPLIGADLFDVIEPKAAEAADAGPEQSDVGRRYFLRASGAQAEGRDDSRGFTVFEGSLGRRETKEMTPSYARLRGRLIDEGVLVPHGADQLLVTRTYVFASPSAAASVLTGASKNGRRAWRDASGRTLEQNQSATAPASD